MSRHSLEEIRLWRQFGASREGWGRQFGGREGWRDSLEGGGGRLGQAINTWTSSEGLFKKTERRFSSYGQL